MEKNPVPAELPVGLNLKQNKTNVNL